MTDLEKIIDDLAYRKRIAPIDSAEWRLANNALIVLRYSCEEAGAIVEDLDHDWGDYVSSSCCCNALDRAAASPAVPTN